MRMAHTELFVNDPLASRDFYERVLGFQVMDVQHEGKVIWLAMGERVLLLRAGPPPRKVPNYQHAGSALVFFTDDLPAEMAALKARGLVFDGDDGPNCPTFKDPDGHWYQLVDPKHA
jgi:catechol 2,3-dioxygenase-like lactoylglutathione lyase family enzyme